MCFTDTAPSNGEFVNSGERRGFWLQGFDDPVDPPMYTGAGGTLTYNREYGGMVYYLGGHSYSPGGENHGARYILNAILLPSQRSPGCGLEVCCVA